VSLAADMRAAGVLSFRFGGLVATLAPPAAPVQVYEAPERDDQVKIAHDRKLALLGSVG
jgi:hypothetical protein